MQYWIQYLWRKDYTKTSFRNKSHHTIISTWIIHLKVFRTLLKKTVKTGADGVSFERFNIASTTKIRMSSPNSFWWHCKWQIRFRYSILTKNVDAFPSREDHRTCWHSKHNTKTKFIRRKYQFKINGQTSTGTFHFMGSLQNVCCESWLGRSIFSILVLRSVQDQSVIFFCRDLTEADSTIVS